MTKREGVAEFMNKMERLQNVNETIRTLKADNMVLADLCGQIRDYVSAEKFLPAELQEETIYHLQHMKEAQISCREGFAALTGNEAFPETFSEAENRMEKQHELFCKEEILHSAIRFKKLVTENPEEVEALRAAQEKVVIAAPGDMTLEECREKYQPYIDFLTTLEENDAGMRIRQVRKLEKYFDSDLIAGAVITRDIHDPEEHEIPFVEEDLDDYDDNTEDRAIPSAISDEEPDEIAPIIQLMSDEPVAEEETVPEPEESEVPEEIVLEPEKSEVPAEIDEEPEDPAEESFREEVPEKDSEVEDKTGNEAEDVEEEGTEKVGENYEITDYLKDFDEKYIEYYCLATGTEERFYEKSLAKWPEEGEVFGQEGVTDILSSIGFHVQNIEEQDRIRDKFENYKVILDSQDSVGSEGESVSLSNFRRDACSGGFRVVCLYGDFTGEELSRAFREIGNRHHTLILFQNAVTQGVRRSLVRLVRREGLRKIFAVLDGVAYEYMDCNYQKENINRIFLDIIMPGPDTE